MRSDNLSTISSQPSSACTIKTSSSSSTTTSGWSLATSSRQWPQAASANHNNNNKPDLIPLSQKAPINNSNKLTGGISASRLAATTTQRDRQYSCAGNKFHRAAIDGYVDMLCEASKRDTNTHAPDDFLQLTPTLLAAQSGQLEALRILVGRGGDPERVSALGSSALHLAAARNHLNCVSFLVNFGANMWALDNELRTAKDLAALGQCQQVLEYLDQMMAKQSAINTKLVQKLKDKAKVAAEKRLKQMRKQQLKAIKQVERDERLLAKLSSNRRLLKSAHSMSDIKLVGRTDAGADNSSAERLAAISFSPNDPLAMVRTSQSLDQQLKTSRFQTTTKVTNFLSRGFQCPPPSTGGKDYSKFTSSDLDSSYCSSSVSSASGGGGGGGYLSSCSARSILKSALARPRRPAPPERDTRAKSPERCRHSNSGATQERPKFSDLVAVGSQHSDSTHSSSSAKSESMLTSRLRGLGGGVSRKVHLKRLLFASTSVAAADDNQEQTPPQHKTCDAAIKTLHDRPAKLCQVSPASRLKMGGERARPPAAANASYGQLKRARSEPDFGKVMRRDEDDDDDDGDNNEEDLDDDHSECREHGDEEENDERVNVPTPPPEPPGPTSPSGVSAEPQQHHLLTRCLSQLKLKQQQQNHIKHDQPPVGPSANGHHKARPTTTTGGAGQLNSDELIRHQLSASEFPLRPSIIKQQLHLKQQQQQQQHQRSQDEKRRKSTTIMSVDSIGSAGSFAQRNTTDLAPATGHSSNNRLQASHGNASSSSSSALSSASFDESTGSTTSEKFDANNNNQHDQMAQFLASNNLLELTNVLARERIDLEALLLLSEADLKSLNILLGPRRKLLNAIGQYKTKQQQQLTNGRTQFTVVDTQF